VVTFILNLLRKSFQVELDSFFKILSSDTNHGASKIDLTSSAFVQNRQKIKPSLFQELLNCLNHEFYTDNDARVKLWNEYRLLAIDGSSLVLPNTARLKDKYGFHKNQHKTEVVMARCSLLYDLENKFIIDGILTPYREGERQGAIKHLEHTGEKDLILFDRGYSSYELFHACEVRGVNYVVRCQKNFNGQVESFIQSKLESQVVSLEHCNKKVLDTKLGRKESLKVRLVRVKLAKGEEEILITSLIEESKYPSKMFKKLYARRWGIETNYSFIKNILEIEKFSSYSPESIEQDFYASIFIRNLQSLLISELEEEVEEKYSKRRYKYKINDTLSIGFLKGRIIELLLSDSFESTLEELKKLLIKNVIPIKPNRKRERKKDQYRGRKKKPKVPKNWKGVL